MPAALALLVALLAVPLPARAAEVVVTLHVDYPILAAALRASLGAANGPAVLWGDAGGCQALVLRDLGVAGDGDRVKITASGEGDAGFEVASFCVLPLSWSGVLEARGRPVVGADWQLRFRDLDSRLLDAHGRSTFVARRLWGILGDAVNARLAAFAFDMAPPADAIRAVVRDAVPADRADVVLHALDTLRPVDATAGADAVAVRVALDVPDVAPSPNVPEPALDADALARWRARLDDWDGFLTFVVKDLGGLDAEPALRDGLFDLLLRSRHALLDVLAAGPQPGADPVRRLFLDAWTELRGLVRQAAVGGHLGEHALRYVAFLAAGDALAALDTAAPALGLEISADGLRRLARTLDPALQADPLAHGDAPDPALRALFGFHEPESSPAGTAVPSDADVDAAAAADASPPTTTAPAMSAPTTTAPTTAAPTTTTAPAAPSPPTTAPATVTTTPSSTTTAPPDATTTTTTPGPGAWWWIAPHAALAEEPPPPPPQVAAIGRALDRWLPPQDQLHRYRDLVSQLLDLTAASEATQSDVAPRFHDLYRQLVRATAWQESCWRQFVERNGRAVPFRSRTGDVGMMQVNLRVWRGFFDVRKLEWDVVYNVGAGAEILAQLLDRYGAKEADRRDGHPARACYAAYNGGPAAFARYRSGKASARDRAVDADFWEKFRTTAAGREMDQVLCQPL